MGRAKRRHKLRQNSRRKGPRKLRAARSCADGRPRGPALGGLTVHGAVVRPVAAAAERQARLVDARQDRRKGAKPEKQNQRDGKYAPHSFGPNETIIPLH